MEMMFSWLKYRSSFISLRVLKQNMEWSNGVIFLMATFWPEGLCMAELATRKSECQQMRAPPSQGSSAHSPYDPVSTLTDYILDIVLLADVEGDLAGGRSAVGRVLARHGDSRWIARQAAGFRYSK